MPLVLPLLAFAIALSGVLPGLHLHRIPRAARVAIPFSGGLLLGVSLFGLLPELTAEIGWVRGLPVFAAGYLTLLLIDRYGVDVCPSCSHDHDHHACDTKLHGYTVPLACAASAHAFLDGWGLVSATADTVHLAFPIAVLIHKFPEGLALGAMLRAANRTRTQAFLWAAAAESFTLAGAWAGLELTPKLGTAWTNYPLALAGGCFCYLGYHAIHGEWHERGPRAALTPALAGLAGAALLQGSILRAL